MGDKIKYPFGVADVQTPAFAANISCNIWNTKTEITVAQLTGNTTLQFVPDPEIMIGSEVSVKLTADGNNRTVALGSNLSGIDIAVNANKVVSASFEWDGLKFTVRGIQPLN